MANFIVDTSVWIDFFAGHLTESLAKNLVTGFENRQVSLTDVILHEILVGAPSKKAYGDLAHWFSALPVLRIEDHQLPDFNLFAWEVRKKGFKGKYTDLNIAFLSKLHRQPVLSFDKYFRHLAKTGWIEVIEI